MGFSRQEYWSGLPFPSPGDLPDLGIETGPPALQMDPLLTELQAILLPNSYFLFLSFSSYLLLISSRFSKHTHIIFLMLGVQGLAALSLPAPPSLQVTLARPTSP